MLCALMNSSIVWVLKTVEQENRDKTIRQIADEHKINLDDLSQTNPFNPALLMAASYLFLFTQRNWVETLVT